MMKIELSKINLIGISLLVAIFEAFGWLFLHIFQSVNNLFLGILVGLPTTIISLFIYNRLFSNNIKIKFNIGNKIQTINKINIIYFTIINIIFLSLLFFIFSILQTITENYFLQGFIGTFLVVFLLVIIYNILNKNRFFIKKINPSISLFFGLTEALILTIQFNLLSASFLNNIYLEYFVYGFISGFVSTLIVILMYNSILNKIIKITFEVR